MGVNAVTYRLESGVALVVLSRPATGNALSTEMLTGLGEALERARSDRAGAVLIRGEGEEFCRGLDLDEAFGFPGPSLEAEEVAARVERYAALLESFRSMPQPIVVLVEGAARGGGVGLAGAADVVLASSRASFQLTEVFFNLLPAVAAAHLTPGRVAPGVLRSHALTGAPLDADRAHQVGLVDRVLAEGAEERGVRAVLRSLLRGSPEALRSVKTFWSDHFEAGAAPAGRAGVLETARLVADPRTAQAVADLQDGRLPTWNRRFRPQSPLTAAGSARAARNAALDSQAAEPGGPSPSAAPIPTSPVVVSGPEDGVLHVRLCDSEGRNALSEAVVTELMAAIDGIEDRADVRTCLLTGLPDVFCSGASQETLEGVASGSIALAEAELAQALLSCPVPIVVAAEGHAVGGGLVLLAAADVVVLAREARFGAVFMELGLTPGMGCTALLPELMGPYLAREMMYTGGTYRGADLERLGARVHRVLPAHQVEEAARSVAGRIAEKSAASLRLLKSTMAEPRLAALAEARRAEDAMHHTLFADPSFATEVMARFAP
jgi:polyketide biosynthesis enoyl-CoA hydratase PksI